MKSKKFTAIITVTALTLIIAGCGNNPESVSTISSITQSGNSGGASSENSGHLVTTEAELSSVNSELGLLSGSESGSAEFSKAPENSKPDTSSEAPVGEPTFFIGLDGKAVLTSEITRLENTDKTAETLTNDDLWADVYCDGFAYYKEPSGIGFDTYNDPELFDGYKFIGETPENKSEWKRANVGDEICGLKVKSASTHFCVNDWEEYKFPERYLYGNACLMKLEGTITAEGILQVNNNSVQYPESNEMMWFYPTKINLPLCPSQSNIDDEKGYETPFNINSVFNHADDLLAYSEVGEISLGKLSDAECDMDGLGSGDIAYARVTLGNISVGYGNGATLESVELLSDIIVHDEDDTEYHQPAPVR